MGDIGAIIDLTPNQGPLALAALRFRLPYTGITYGSQHTTVLSDFLVAMVLGFMTDESDNMYSAKVAALMNASKEKKPKPAFPVAAKKAKAKAAPPEAQLPTGSSKAEILARIKAMQAGNGKGKGKGKGKASKGGDTPNDDDQQDDLEEEEEEEEEEAEE